MKILIVCSYKEDLPNNMAPFIWEQTKALTKLGAEISYFLVKGNGINGYLKSFPKLKSIIHDSHPDLIHAHFGLCGLLANLQRKIPVVTTYHGSDINNAKVRVLSKFAIRLSAHNIFVSQKLVEIAKPKKKYSIIPCGINLEDYPIVDKDKARKEMGLEIGKKYVLFSGAFDNPVKNYPLAKEAIDMIPDTELLELKGYNRHQVALLMNAVDCFLMTSHSEGSPQVIKEAMACGCPIVSVDVGDAKDVTHDVLGCHVFERTAESIASALSIEINRSIRTAGRERILTLGYSNDLIAKKIISAYYSAII